MWCEPLAEREELLFVPGRVRHGSPGDSEQYPGSDDDEMEGLKW